MTAKRAIRDFSYAGNLWLAADNWARDQGYRSQRQSDNQHTYKKGLGFWTAPRMVEITANGSQVHLEAWVHSPLLTRITSLFILPREITVESGGFKGALPRKLGRTEVNSLLYSLGQKPIE